MTYRYGSTFGKMVMKIRVYKENEERLSLIDVIYRETIGSCGAERSFGIDCVLCRLVTSL